MNFGEIEADIRNTIGNVEHLLYTPQLKHPLLEDVRQIVVREIQAHMSQVLASATGLGNNVIQALEKSLLTQTA